MPERPFPDSDVSIHVTDYYSLNKGDRWSKTFHVTITPKDDYMPTKRQIDKMSCRLIEAACEAMEEMRHGKDTVTERKNDD